MGGEGLSNKKIALLLRLAVRRVDFHVGHILEKLGVGSRLEAVSIGEGSWLCGVSGGASGRLCRPKTGNSHR